MIIDVQFNQGSAPWQHLRDAVLAAEASGFGTVWNLDHFSGEMFGSDSMLECFTTLSAWAAVTSRIGVGTLVTNVNNRHPGLLANIVSTIQEVSGGRLVLGIGAGTSPTSPYGAEQRALGMEVLPTMAQRHQRLLDNVAFMRSIWAHDRDASFAGFPRPLVVPPVIVGVNSPGLAAIAGRHFDGINVRFDHPDRDELIRVACTERGGRAGFDVSVWAPFRPEHADPGHPLHAGLVEAGVTRMILLDTGAPDLARIERVAAYLA